jgi:hypothetical protein
LFFKAWSGPTGNEFFDTMAAHFRLALLDARRRCP